MNTIIYNGKAITPGGIIENGYAVITEGIISGTGSGAPPRLPAHETYDAQGKIISPGLADIHIHGAGGHWAFQDAEDIGTMAAAIVRNGVTAFLPSTVSLPHKQVLACIDAIRAAIANQPAGPEFATPSSPPSAARILGIHLEGPYISPARPGAHIPTVIRNPEPAELDEIFDRAGSDLRMLCLAPEIPGAHELIVRLAEHNAVAAIGHSDATSAQTHEAARLGASHFIHLFNAVRPFHHREPGCSFAAIADPRITIEIIFDTVHVHPEAARVAIAAKGPRGVVLVSDSIHAAGCGDGDFNVWGFDITVSNGQAKTKSGNLAGSVITLNKAVLNATIHADVSLPDAIMMASENPLRVLGLDSHAGTIAAGKAGDIAIFDENMDCLATFIAGTRVY